MVKPKASVSTKRGGCKVPRAVIVDTAANKVVPFQFIILGVLYELADLESKYLVSIMLRLMYLDRITYKNLSTLPPNDHLILDMLPLE